MSLFDRIEKIRNDNRLGVTEFLELTGFSKTSYYALKKGESTSLTAKTANKVIEAFSNYDYDWLMGNYQNVLSSDEIPVNQDVKNELFLEKNGVKITAKEVGDFCAANFDDVRNESQYFDLVSRDKINKGIEAAIVKAGLQVVYTKKEKS